MQELPTGSPNTETPPNNDTRVLLPQMGSAVGFTGFYGQGMGCLGGLKGRRLPGISRSHISSPGNCLVTFLTHCFRLLSFICRRP